MAEIAHAVDVATQGAANQNTTSTYTKPGASGTLEIEGSELDGSSDYILIVRMHCSGNSTTNNSFEFKIEENGVGELTGSHERLEPRRSALNAGDPYTYVRKVTTAASPNDYEVQIKSDGASTASVMDVEMVMIKLDDLLSSDWAYDNDAVDNSFAAGVYEDGASITIGDGTSDWLIITTAHWDVGAVNDDMIGRINIGGSNVMDYAHEADDLVEQRVIGCFHYEAALASSTVVKNQFTNSTSNNDVIDNSIFALRLNAFEDHDGSRNTVKTDSGGATPVEPIGLTHTADTAADPQEWIAFSQCKGDVQGSNQRRTYTAISDESDVDFSGDDNSNPFFVTHGTADLQTMNRMGVNSQADAADLDWKFSTSDQGSQTGMDYVEQIICGFSWVLAPQPASFLPFHGGRPNVLLRM